MMFNTYTLFILICIFCRSNAEVYTALADLEELLNTESQLLRHLQSYLNAEENRIVQLKKYFKVYENEHLKANQDIQTYVANPINAYILVKRLTTDWKHVEHLVRNDNGVEFLANVTAVKETLKYPTDEDLSGAAVALMRLQDTYKLDTSSLARGELNGVKYSAELSAADCFELGRQSYNNEDFYHTILWMREADNRLIIPPNSVLSYYEEQNGTELKAAQRKIKNNVENLSRADILEYLAFSTYKQGNVLLALELTNKLLEINPNHARALGNKVYYEEELWKLQEKRNLERLKGDDGSDNIPTVHYFARMSNNNDVRRIKNYEYELYEQLCRGEVAIDATKLNELKCYMFSTLRRPFLMLAPFKVEEAYTNPDILVFYDVISNSEIEDIKRLAYPRFRRATVQNSETGELEVAQYRISKSAWLKESDHNNVATITHRVQDMTGLTMSTAEELQVVNYGIGGHYEPHFDFARKEEKNAFKSLGTGNRIATVLFYMSDVAQGGATVFPEIKVSLWPKKGAAAFWFNLHSSGDGNRLTRHAACPVLAGSKWVSNKWIHEQGQEFLRPCALQRPSELDIA